jgi:ribonuclease D
MLPSPVLVADAAALSNLVADLAASPTVAVDTESNSFHAYRERVCLLQFTTPAADYIVDPLALRDLSALAPFFASPAHEKIFHAAEGDLFGLGRDFQFTFANIFDTMSAARTLGWPQVGLAAVLKSEFDVTLSKKHQRADWGRRPLTADLLDYARLDTHYLASLRDKLYIALTENGRWPEAQEDFERIARTQPAVANQTLDPQAFWRVKGSRYLTPHQAAILREVFTYRDRESARTNQPPFRVIGEPTLLDIAQRAPKTIDDLKGIVAMTPGQIHRHGQALLRCVADGLAATPPAPPVVERPPDDVQARYDRLQHWRKTRAQARGVESDVILARTTMWDLATRAPRGLDDLADIADFGPTRRAMYGKEILAIL